MGVGVWGVGWGCGGRSLSVDTGKNFIIFMLTSYIIAVLWCFSLLMECIDNVYFSALLIRNASLIVYFPHRGFLESLSTCINPIHPCRICYPLIFVIALFCYAVLNLYGFIVGRVTPSQAVHDTLSIVAAVRHTCIFYRI